MSGQIAHIAMALKVGRVPEGYSCKIPEKKAADDITVNLEFLESKEGIG